MEITFNERDIKMAIKTPSSRRILPSSSPKVDLRDYYIAAALTGLCANSNIVHSGARHEASIEKHLAHDISVLARKIADEVMLERTR